MALTAESYVRDILYLRRYLTSELQARGFNVQDLETFEVLFPLIITSIDKLNEGSDGLREEVRVALESLGYDIDVTTTNTMLNAISDIVTQLEDSNEQLTTTLEETNNTHAEEIDGIVDKMRVIAELSEGTEETFDNYYQVVKNNIETIAVSLMEMYPDDIYDFRINALTPFILDNQTGWLKIRTNEFVNWNHLFYNYIGDPTFLMKHIESAENCRGMLNGCTFDGDIRLVLPHVTDCAQLGGNFNELQLELHRNSTIDMYRFMSGATLKSLTLKYAIPSNCEGMFYGASQLREIHFEEVSLNEATNFTHMFDGCVSLLELDLPEAFLNNPKMTDTTCMFQNCLKLETIPMIDFTGVIQTSLMFYSCTNLKNITFKENTLNTPLTLASSRQLTHDSLISVLNSLVDRTGQEPYALSIGTVNLGTLDDVDIAIATNKNWTVS